MFSLFLAAAISVDIPSFNRNETTKEIFVNDDCTSTTNRFQVANATGPFEIVQSEQDDNSTLYKMAGQVYITGNCDFEIRNLSLTSNSTENVTFYAYGSLINSDFITANQVSWTGIPVNTTNVTLKFPLVQTEGDAVAWIDMDTISFSSDEKVVIAHVDLGSPLDALVNPYDVQPPTPTPKPDIKPDVHASAISVKTGLSALGLVLVSSFLLF